MKGASENLRDVSDFLGISRGTPARTRLMVNNFAEARRHKNAFQKINAL